MILTLNAWTIADGGSASIALPDDLLWVDEFKWVPATQTQTYSVTGALIIETALKLAGRPITLEGTADMAWVQRSTLDSLRAWAGLSNRTFTLTFAYPTDTRSFVVVFDQSSGAIEGHPAKDFPQHDSADWFTVKMNLIQV
jgi:hypothetical protein